MPYKGNVSYKKGCLKQNPDLSCYMNDLKKVQIFTKEEERKLFKKVKNKKIREKLIVSQLPLVIKLANSFYFKFMDVDVHDLVQVGNIGVITAVDKFDLKYNNKLSTYSYFWIFKEMMEYAVTNGIIKISRTVYRSEDDKKKLSRIYNYIGLNEDIKDKEIDISEKMDREEEIDRVKEAMYFGLDDRESLILQRRMYGDKLREIGDDLKLTKERVRQIQKRAVNKVKNYLTKHYNYGKI